MKRSALYAVLAAGALVVAGCGSSQPGTPAPAPTGNVSTPAASTPASPPVSTPPASTQQQSSDSAGPGSQTADTGASDTGSANTGQADTDQSAGSVTAEPTITVGGALDSQTTAWFTTFCTGFGSALAGMTAASPTGSATDEQTAFVKLYNTIGDAYTKTAAALAPLPPPTFTGGTQLAQAVVTGMGQAGPAMKQAAQAIAAVDPTNASALESAEEAASNASTSALSSMSNFALDDNTTKALGGIPACAPLMASGDESGTPTT